MHRESIAQLAHVFLGRGNGDLFKAIRELYNEMGKGTPVEAIFEKILIQARREATAEEDSYRRFEEWAKIASHSGRISDFVAADTCLAEIDSHRHSVASKILAILMLRAGYADAARKRAKLIYNYCYRAEAFARLYETTGDENDLKLAETALENITSDDCRDEANAQIQAAKRKVEVRRK